MSRSLSPTPSPLRHFVASTLFHITSHVTHTRTTHTTAMPPGHSPFTHYNGSPPTSDTWPKLSPLSYFDHRWLSRVLSLVGASEGRTSMLEIACLFYVLPSWCCLRGAAFIGAAFMVLPSWVLPSWVLPSWVLPSWWQRFPHNDSLTACYADLNSPLTHLLTSQPSYLTRLPLASIPADIVSHPSDESLTNPVLRPIPLSLTNLNYYYYY